MVSVCLDLNKIKASKKRQPKMIKMETKPRIQLKLSTLDKLAELTGKIFLFVTWGLAVYAFSQMPKIIPIHFNASGEADRYGNKLTILILPLLATIIYFGLTQLNKQPHIFNYKIKITRENAQQQYTIATRTLRFLKLAILLVFSLIILFTYLATIGVTNGLGIWFLPLTVGLLMIPVIVLIIQSLKK